MIIDELIYKINGCEMEVYKTLGNWFQEVIYQRYLAIEMERASLSFGSDKEQSIYYDYINVI
jgi:GxxExxY protein